MALEWPTRKIEAWKGLAVVEDRVEGQSSQRDVDADKSCASWHSFDAAPDVVNANRVPFSVLSPVSNAETLSLELECHLVSWSVCVPLRADSGTIS